MKLKEKKKKLESELHELNLKNKLIIYAKNEIEKQFENESQNFTEKEKKISQLQSIIKHENSTKNNLIKYIFYFL